MSSIVAVPLNAQSWNLSFGQQTTNKKQRCPLNWRPNNECCKAFWRKSIFHFCFHDEIAQNVSEPKWVLHIILTKEYFHFRIMDFTMKSLRMWAKQSECCILLWRKSIFHFWIMDFTMKSLTVSSNGRGVSREQNKISHGCADPSSPPARPENNMDVNYGDDGDVT